MKLLEHFKAMQEMARRYLIPEDYVDRDGQSSKVAVGTDTAVRNNLFVGDLIYMLDGPEQRAAQAELEDERQVVVRFALKPGVTREQLVEFLVDRMTDDDMSVMFGLVAELEVDGVVHMNV